MTIKPKLYVLIFILFSFFQSIVFAQEKKTIQRHWTSYSQRIDISKKKNLEFRFSAYVRMGDLKQNGTPALWLRIDDNEGQTGFFYNTIKDKNFVPSDNWERLEITGIIDENAKYLYIGAFCQYNGDFYFDDFKLEVKSKNGTWEVEKIDNGGFEEKKSQDNWASGVEKSKSSKDSNFKIQYSIYRPFKGQYSLHIKGSNIPKTHIYFENFKNDKALIWFRGWVNNYEIKIDSITKYKGDYSLLMQSFENYQPTCDIENSYIPIGSTVKGNFKDKEIKLTGYIKTEGLKDNGETGLWVRTNPQIQTGFKNMQRKTIINDSKWTKYELVIIPHIDTFNLNFGALLSGYGKIWVDNLELSVDNIPIQLYKKNENKLNQEEWLFKYYKANATKNEAITISNNEQKKEKLHQAIVYCNEAIDLVKGKNLKEKLISLYITKATIYSLYNDNSFKTEKTINNYFKALELAKSYNDLNSIFIIQAKMAYFYSSSNYYKESNKILKQIIHDLEHIKHSKPNIYNKLIQQQEDVFPRTNSFIVHNYIELKDIENAKHFNKLFFESFKNQESYSYRNFLSSFYINKGDIDLLKHNYTDASNSYQKAKELIGRKCDELGQLTSIHYSLGKVAYLLEEYEKAYQILEEGLTFGKSWHEVVSIHDDYFFFIAKSYANENKLKKATKYFEMHAKYSSDYEKEEDTIAIVLRRKEVEINNKEKSILELKKQKSEYYLLWISIFFFLVIICGGYLFRISKRKNEQKFKAILKEIQNRDQKISLLKIKDNSPKTVLDINTETVTKILKGLQNLEEKNYFLKSECTTVNVAKKLKTNTTYLSKVISSHYQTNFNSYINNLRINYALSRLKEDIQFRNYSIQSISEELGYKSPDSFTKYFKKHTGLLPSYFIKSLNTKQNTST